MKVSVTLFGFYAGESKEWDFKDQLLLLILASSTSKNESFGPAIKVKQIVTFINFYFEFVILCSSNI